MSALYDPAKVAQRRGEFVAARDAAQREHDEHADKADAAWRTVTFYTDLIERLDGLTTPEGSS